MGQSVYTKQYSSADQNGPFTFRMDLNPGTLNLDGATLSYKESGSREDVDVLKDRVFKKGFYEAKSAVKANLTYALNLTLSLNSSGIIQSSRIGFDLGGSLSGSLVDLSITSNSAALSILKTVNRLNPQSLLTSLITTALQNLNILPSFNSEPRSPGLPQRTGRTAVVQHRQRRLLRR